MAEKDRSGGAVGRLWRKHGGGYYALLAVGTFVFLEVRSLMESVGDAQDVGDFVRTELVETIFTFGIETVVNTFLAGIWPFMWVDWMGLTQALLWAGGGYALWTVCLAAALARREKAYRKELGL